MRTATQPIRIRRARTATATATATDNRYTTLISDFDSDSKTESVYSIYGLSDTDSEISAVNHQAYQAGLFKDLRILEDRLGYFIQKEDSDDDSYDDEDTVIITPKALKTLCSTSLTPLKE